MRTSVRRASLCPEEGNVHDAEAHAKPKQHEVEEHHRQNHLRTDLEMWLMEGIPELYGVSESEELRESLREDGQASQVEALLQILGADSEAARKMLEEWLHDAQEPAREAFIQEIMTKATGILTAG
mmetsp:Transcript_60780/g.181067  ORF Transcript_60780/g.181067 Transcript_60780/m.181067 type:complete len:126 (+) Transcript_60780:71-448(+)